MAQCKYRENVVIGLAKTAEVIKLLLEMVSGVGKRNWVHIGASWKICLNDCVWRLAYGISLVLLFLHIYTVHSWS